MFRPRRRLRPPRRTHPRNDRPAWPACAGGGSRRDGPLVRTRFEDGCRAREGRVVFAGNNHVGDGVGGGNGAGGIRTLGTVTRTPHFQCGPFSHSDTAPAFGPPIGRGVIPFDAAPDRTNVAGTDAIVVRGVRRSTNGPPARASMPSSARPGATAGASRSTRRQRSTPVLSTARLGGTVDADKP